jgi:hypothetical protein
MQDRFHWNKQRAPIPFHRNILPASAPPRPAGIHVPAVISAHPGA